MAILLEGGVDSVLLESADVLLLESDGAATATVAPNDSTNAHTIAAPTVSILTTAAPADLTVAHTIAQPTVTISTTVVPNDSTNAHTIDSPTVTTSTTVAPSDLTVAHTIDSPTVTISVTVAPTDLTVAHTIAQPTVTISTTVAPDDSTNAHTISSPTVTISTTVAPDDSTNAHTIDSPNVSIEYASTSIIASSRESVLTPRSVAATADGTLWAMVHNVFGTDAHEFYYSTDNGTTWTENVSLRSTTDTGADTGLFAINTVQDISVYWAEGETAKIIVGLTTSSTTWVDSASPNGFADSRDMVVFEKPGSTNFFVARIVTTTFNNIGDSLQVWEFTAAGAYVAQAYSVQLQSVSFSGSLDFAHTGDGNTVVDATPDLYVSYSESGGNHPAFRKFTYSAGTWTPGTETVLTADGNQDPTTLVFDGTRALVTVCDNGTDRLFEVDPSDSSVTDLTSGIPASPSTQQAQLRVSYHHDGFTLWLYDSTADDIDTVTYTRSTDTWGAWTELISHAGLATAHWGFSVYKGVSSGGVTVAQWRGDAEQWSGTLIFAQVKPDDSTVAHTIDQPTVSISVTVDPNDSTNAHTIDSPTVSILTTVAPTDLTIAHTISSPTITTVPEAQPTDLTVAHTISEPAITTNIEQSLTLPLIASTSTLYTPDVSGGSLELPLIASASAVYAPTVTLGDARLTLPLIASTTRMRAFALLLPGVTPTPPSSTRPKLKRPGFIRGGYEQTVDPATRRGLLDNRRLIAEKQAEIDALEVRIEALEP